MKILYAVQGTGNGHLSRAMDIVPLLREMGEVDVLVSGIQGDLELAFPVRYKLKGMSFIFGKAGGVNLWKTIVKADLRALRSAIRSLPVHEYDLIINDFEPVSAWACYFQNKPCIGLSHQAAVIAPNAPKASHADPTGRLILNNYAPASVHYGFHFERYNKNVFTPVIRQAVRDKELKDMGYYTVYLPAYDDERLIKQLTACKNVQWEVFSKHNKKSRVVKNVSIQPVNSEKFTASMAMSTGVLCGAGFETPAEALFMKKKLLVIPMKGQYEQHLNAAALMEMGVPVMKSLKSKHSDVLSAWLESNDRITVDYPDETRNILETIVARHG
ncbi:glycosyltransferase family protein [Pedobacter deserti]|uniref:glycosyltransferase family protein n=1 Tax=Pedobacter deserti TaxID=2817382 RepID=UPI00210F2073|nr:glycosyltransferase family protein [Pedobacter sp. SYSU D00382]